MRVYAPAKVNLYLHVTQRLRNGYHALDSLVMFADIGDEIFIEASDAFDFKIDGAFAQALQGRDVDIGPQSGNLVVKAAWRLARLFDRSPNVTITLTKNLPLGAGIGGGSADAAAVIWGLCDLWNIPRDDEKIFTLLIELGADVPVCFSSMSSRIKGIGDVYEPVSGLPELPAVLVHPGKPCSTIDVFKRIEVEPRELIALPAHLEQRDALLFLLGRCQNDLREAATYFVPEIDNVYQALQAEAGCDLARMSGSGSCCFGIFETIEDARQAATSISCDNPDWWVSATMLGAVQRY